MRERITDRGQRRLRTIITIIATAVVIAPAAALATNSFTDVGTSEFYHDAVDWAKANGVTVGCNPPDNTRFCPDDFVTRGQMAVFLERLDTENVFVRPGDDAVDGGNADTVDGMHASDFLGATDKAVDSDKLDGQDSSAFLGASAKAADADQLDGMDSSEFVASSNLLWALVDDTGVLIDGSGATAATRLGEGDFRVTFNRTINSCIVLGTGVDVSGGAVPAGSAARIVSTDNRVQSDNSTVDVNTTNPSGADADPISGDGFAITVHC